MKTDTPRPIRLKDYSPPTHLIEHVDLDVSLAPSATTVTAKLTLRHNPATKTRSSSLKLDGEGLDLQSIAINNKPLKSADFTVGKNDLTIKSTPAKCVLETTVIINPETNKALQGLYLTRGVYCTQCEAEGFRRITYFLDRPDVLSTYKVRIEADPTEAAVLLSNGNPLERGTLDNGRRHYAVWRDPHPKPCYLFALVGGNLSPVASSFKTMSGRKVDLAIYVEPGKEDRTDWAMDSLKRSMAWDETRFGREYDLDVFNIVAVSHFNMGAMENKGLNIFNDRLILASADKATDNIYQAIEGVVAHEYFHNWTGNRITCRDWFQLCLKEGLTVYRDQEFSADERSRTVQRIRDVRQLRAHQFPEDAGPLAHPVRPEHYIEINNFYTATVYEKGAELVRMLATILGENTFRKGMDEYFEQHDGDAATIEDFLTCFERTSKTDLTQFKRWYQQAGTPQVSVQATHNPKKNTFTLDLEQKTQPTPGQDTKKPFHIPVRFGLLEATGQTMDRQPVANETGPTPGILHLTKRRQKFVFQDVSAPPIVSLFQDFSAPVNVEYEQCADELVFLARNDTDGFNRWQALNTLATRILLERAEAMKNNSRSNAGVDFVDALGVALADETLDNDFKAELLRLPSQPDLAREIATQVDPGIIHRTHRQFQAFIGRRLGDQLEATYKKLTTTQPYSADANQMGARALRNACLILLTARGTSADQTRLTQHYQRARNMTDAAQALFLLAGQPPAIQKPAFEHFYKKWKKDHLVIDTWLAAIGQTPRSGALAAIKRTMKDPVFDIYVPNKVRALIGSFAMQNQMQFHRADGAGYRFFADQIIQIDTFNPQLAARLLGALSSWSTLEEKRRGLARAELKRISKSKKLSRDVFEIVSRMLGQSEG